LGFAPQPNLLREKGKIMTIGIVYFIIAFIGGMGLGFFYFLGLWLTVKSLPLVSWPAILTFSSFVGRMAVTLCGFYLIAMNGHWGRLLVALLGFLVMRGVLVRRWGERKGVLTQKEEA
jgi:F1F0 ATPase subunit 2